MNPEITVYTLPVCPKCNEMKETLREAGLEFTFKDLEDYDNYAELLLSQVTFTEAPIVKINGHFFDYVGAKEHLNLN